MYTCVVNYKNIIIWSYREILMEFICSWEVMVEFAEITATYFTVSPVKTHMYNFLTQIKSIEAFIDYGYVVGFFGNIPQYR